jgi:hypothetical protein
VGQHTGAVLPKKDRRHAGLGQPIMCRNRRVSPHASNRDTLGSAAAIVAGSIGESFSLFSFMAHPKHIDHLLKEWRFRFGDVLARKVRGSDRRQLLQMRIDMGILQMETSGRPDGERPEGFETYYDYLVSLSFHEGADFELTSKRCLEIDREFVQFYHRRICWLALKEYQRAAEDADHTLRLMDFSTAHSPDDNWSLMHEQYRPYVLFHRTQALALTELQETHPEQAVQTIEQGLGQLREIFEEYEAEDEFDESELVVKLRQMRDTLVKDYELGPSLAEQLAEAIAKEEYELAARLRDRINGQRTT